MIPRVHARGTRIGGLIRYLYGPGRKEEHGTPRLVAAWDGAGDLAALEPAVRADGRRDFTQLVGLLTDPVVAGIRPPQKFVWHCSVRLAPEDRTLSDAQWGHIARELMAQAGLAPHGDPDAVRWVAIRHGDDHVHLAATLVRQDRRTEWARNDYPRCRAAALDLERRYGLRQTAPADRTGHRRPHPHEMDKAARQRRTELPRERLRRQVRAAAASALDEADFFGRLRSAGVRVRLRHSIIDPAQVTGYAVALPDHQAADGRPVWYGGGRLAPDLTLPQLRPRWGQSDSEPARAVGPAGSSGPRRTGTRPRRCGRPRQISRPPPSPTPAPPPPSHTPPPTCSPRPRRPCPAGTPAGCTRPPTCSTGPPATCTAGTPAVGSPAPGNCARWPG
jgi:hypothetical protein